MRNEYTIPYTKTAPRLEICGGMASGKTTLAKLLEKHGYPALYERYWENPFFNEFYQNHPCAYETEIVFTMLHYHGLLYNTNGCSDYSLLQDLAYADINLTVSQYNAYLGLFDELLHEAGTPSHLIYIKCSAEEAFNRMKQRNREQEVNVPPSYLENIITALENRILKHPNILILDSEEYDFFAQEQEVVNIINDFFPLALT